MNALSADLSMSLREKLSQHWQKKQANMVANNMKLFNVWAPTFLHVVFLGAIPWGMLEVIPEEYKDSWTALLAAELFTAFGFIQVMVNWILLWQVDSTYEPAVHGTEPLTSQLRAAVRKNQDVNWSNGAAEANSLTYKGGASQSHYADDSSPDPLFSNRMSSTDGETYQVYVATGITEDGVERRAVPYWSWVPCLVCQKPRPPRCHHCTLCKRCVLKRDHHCFFGRNCVGFNNQRFFIYFLAWSAVLTGWGSYLLPPYVFRHVLPHYSYWDFVWPVNVVRTVFGYFPLAYLHLASVSLGTMILLVFSTFMLAAHINLVLRGVTSFEFDAKVKVADTRPFASRLRSVLGENWGLSLLLPGFAWSEPLDDPVYWPYLKVS